MYQTRTQRHNRGPEAYEYNDSYVPKPSRGHAYEYVGTDEPPSYPPSPRHGHASVNHPARLSRTTSPARRTRHSGHHDHGGSRRVSPTRHGKDPSKRHSPREKYQDFAQRPGVKRAQTYGKKGLNFLGSAAAAYMEAQNGPDPRGRSMGRDPYDGYHSDHGRYHDSRRDHPRSRRHGYSPSPSPSPPPRGRRSRHQGRRSTYSESPPPLSRDRDRYDQSRGHRHDKSRRRAYSYSPSPHPRDRDRGRGRGKSGSGGFVSSLRSHTKGPDKANATRWQMAARAALEAGGATALRLRKEPGSWTGDKGAKVATAALGAAAIDAFIDTPGGRARVV